MAANKRWYVEATGHTNEVIARELPEENAHKDVLCHDGKKRDMWVCNYAFITKLVKNETVGQLQFRVFYREGRHGPAKPWPFLKRKRKPAIGKGMAGLKHHPTHPSA